MQLLGNLPSLAILQLYAHAFDIEGLRLDFLPEAFQRLVALELCNSQRSYRSTQTSEIKSVEFKAGAAPKLEVLKFTYRYAAIRNNAGLFFGLASLPNLKRFELGTGSSEGKEPFVEDVRAQLAQNQNRPVLIKDW
jgi:hypothetical protein